MKIGYSVEGSTDRAILEGLRRRWCLGAELVEGRFRGQTGESRRRELRRISLELNEKSVDFMIFLTDSNAMRWRDVYEGERARCHPDLLHLAIFGVCLRNAESWLASDAVWLGHQTGRKAADYEVDDPKGQVEAALMITKSEKREEEIARLVEASPLSRWMKNPSFEHFFDQLWNKSKELGCKIENLRERDLS